MGIFDKFKEMAELKEEASKLEEILQEIESVDEAGNGAIEVRVNGDGKIIQVHLRDSFFQEKDREKQQKWITIAVNGAIEKARKRVQKEIKKMENLDKFKKFLK